MEERRTLATRRQCLSQSSQSSVSISGWSGCLRRLGGTYVLCGHGGERQLNVKSGKCKVDGYEPTTETVYEFNGCKWHGSSFIEDENPKMLVQLFVEELERRRALILKEVGK